MSILKVNLFKKKGQVEYEKKIGKCGIGYRNDRDNDGRLRKFRKFTQIVQIRQQKTRTVQQRMQIQKKRQMPG